LNKKADSNIVDLKAVKKPPFFVIEIERLSDILSECKINLLAENKRLL